VVELFLLSCVEEKSGGILTMEQDRKKMTANEESAIDALESILDYESDKALEKAMGDIDKKVEEREK